jgi:hypothetical protein
MRSILFALICCIAAFTTGCATCREHPVACTVAIVGSVAVAGYEASHRDHSGRPQGMSNTQPVNCAANPALCQ